jgi:DNA end-binding protein Ku
LCPFGSACPTFTAEEWNEAIRGHHAQGHQDGGPDKFEDQYETALIDLINQKCAGKPIAAKERPRGENVVDLMDALRKSIGAAAAESSVPKKPTKKPRKASAGQKEMLMPIAGKKQAKETAKKPAARPQRKSA